MSILDSPKQNMILSALSEVDFARQLEDLELVELQPGQVLYEMGSNVDYVYFPTTCVVSLFFSTENGGSIELAMTGNEGLIGVALILGGNTTTHRIVVQKMGKAYRLRSEVMRWELDQGGYLMRLSLRYAQALMTQIAQGVVCNRYHTLDQQLCRWLLLNLDRMQDNKLDITQERISSMLGVRREGITEAAGHLQADGLIRYSRGHIEILDRQGLEARVCECYSIVKIEYRRLYQMERSPSCRNHERPDPSTQRQRAENRLQKNQPPLLDIPLDSVRMLHELQVHQIELEMQNEELRLAYAEADGLRERYADIYDFSPVGYFTIDAQGAILDLNLAGAILLCIQRSQKDKFRFENSIVPKYRDNFSSFLHEVLHSKGKKTCEVELLPTLQNPQSRVRIEGVPDENGQECRMVVIRTTPK